ncbi:MAG: alpha/beta hydrolase, partial [Pseudomonadota bacterium]
SLDLVSQDRFVVVGCSVGGSCALEVLNLAPERVAAAILIGTKARCDPDPTSLSAACRTIEDQGVAAAWQRYWSPLFEGDEGGKIAQHAKEIALEQSATDLRNGLTAFYTRNSREDVVIASRIPIHVVTGDRDTLSGPNYARRLAGLSNKASFHVIENCGHYVPMMQPKALNRLIADVLRDVEQDPLT